FAVAHGVGSVRFKAGQSSKAILSSVSSSSTDSRVYFALDRKLTGKGRQYVSLIGRDKGSARYELKTRVEKKGKVTIWLVRKADGKSTILAKATPSVTLPNKGTLAIRLQVTGTSPTKLRAKVWNAKRQEPTKWTVRATDKKAKLQSAGAVGLWVYTGPSVSNGPVTVFFDDLYVTRP
ncbi:MAG: hypothetical protein VB093_06710, partial [Propionicimonas sp.]|nr:hypothetical protein [Propionicimonas sp.]